MQSISLVLAVALMLSLHSGVRAELLAYESFEFGEADESILGKGSGEGFGGMWGPGGYNARTHDNFRLGQESLSYPNLKTSGRRLRTNSTEAISAVMRKLAKPIGLDDSTVYMSFLIRPEGVLGRGAWNGFFGIVLDQPREPELFIGKPGNGQTTRFVLEDRGSPRQYSSNLQASIGETSLLVLKMEFLDGKDRFTLYTNPTVGEGEPAEGVVKHDVDVQRVDAITIYSTGEFELDELRIGNSFEDVTP